MTPPLQPSMEYLDWRYIAGALLDVFEENKRHHAADPSQVAPSADLWCTVDYLREDVWHRARMYWMIRSGYDATWFPYGVDGTARLYFRFRKRNRFECADYRREIAGVPEEPGLFPDPPPEPETCPEPPKDE